MARLMALLRDLRGDLSQEAWARDLEVSQRAVSSWLSGGPVGKKGLLALSRRYPHRQDEIVDAIFDSEGVFPEPSQEVSV